MVPPTEVTLKFRKREGSSKQTTVVLEADVREARRLGTDKGHEGGKSGTKRVALRPSLVKHCWNAGFASPSPTPPSPDEKSSEVPRAPDNDDGGHKSTFNARRVKCIKESNVPSCANSLQTRLAKLTGTESRKIY